jgi:hypothetical protein
VCHVSRIRQIVTNGIGSIFERIRERVVRDDEADSDASGDRVPADPEPAD